MNTISKSRARTLTQEIKANLQTLQDNLIVFHAAKGWEALGYLNFSEWWDSEIGSDLPIATGLRNWVILRMFDESQVDGKLVPGTISWVAEAVGVSESVVRSLRHRTRHIHVTPTVGFVVPKSWHNNLHRMSELNGATIADMLRPIVQAGVKRKYGVDLNEG